MNELLSIHNVSSSYTSVVSLSCKSIISGVPSL